MIDAIVAKLETERSVNIDLLDAKIDSSLELKNTPMII
jgi:hypothetical protein